MENEDLTLVFKALSHPSRREILDWLKSGPMTTGEISEKFTESRYAVMKHLDILEKADLVLSRKKGRVRLNYLNAVPIQQLYNRWVNQYESQFANSLINLKEKLEKNGDSNKITISDNVSVRAMKNSEKEIILNMTERFTEFELMEWRNLDDLKQAQYRLLQESFVHKNENDDFYVAVDNYDKILGFLHVTNNIDFFTGEEQGYVSSIVVSTNGEGRGIGRKLMQKAEDWAISKGYKKIVLNVFAKNERAIKFYEKLNYQNEVIKMVKEL